MPLPNTRGQKLKIASFPSMDLVLALGTVPFVGRDGWTGANGKGCYDVDENGDYPCRSYGSEACITCRKISGSCDAQFDQCTGQEFTHFYMPDDDYDGVTTDDDNCPETSNPDQADWDEDGTGDACDPDKDGDGKFLMALANDNRQYVNEIDQTDTDGDSAGDACDNDDDNDSIPDDQDNRQYVYNPDQADIDENDVGDACDPDDDGDGVCDGDAAASETINNVTIVCNAGPDNCPATSNGDQTDTDTSGIGDVRANAGLSKIDR